MKLVAAAAALHRWAAVEASAFEILGAWVPTTSDPTVKGWLAVQARHHGERAGMWQRLAPVDYGLDAAAARGAGPLVEGLDVPVDDGARLAAALGLVEAMLAEYRAALLGASPVSDGPMIRGLRRAVAEIEAELAAIASAP